jgi:PAS domain S-box-containing protein
MADVAPPVDSTSASDGELTAAEADAASATAGGHWSTRALDGLLRLITLPDHRPPAPVAYGAALAIVAAATALLVALDAWVELTAAPLSVMVWACVAAAWYGGVRAGLLAAVAVGVMTELVLIDARWSFFSSADTIRALALVTSSAVAVGLFGAAREAQRRAHWRAESRRELLQKAMASERRLRVALDATPAVVFEQDTDLRYTWIANPHPGFDGTPVIGRCDEELLPPDETAVLTEIKRRVMATRRRERCEVRATIGGVAHYYELTVEPRVNGRGAVDGVVCLSYDVTPRKETEDALRASEARYRDLASAMPQLVWSAGPDGRVDYYNDRIAEFSADARGEEGRSRWGPIVHPEDLQRTREAWRRSVRTGEAYECEHRLRMADGSYCWHVTRAQATHDADGNVVKWYGTATEIDELRRTQDQLYAANAAKDEFLSLVSHELKTPITTIIGNAEILHRRGSDLDERQRNDAVGDIRQGSERLNRIIENLLILARLDRGQVLEVEPLRVPRLVERVAERHERRFPGRPIVRRWGEREERALVTAVESYVEQVADNLLSNAEKYSPPGAPIEVAIEREDATLTVRVLDQGVGITDEEAERLFTPFFRSPRVAQQTSGVGIGLAVCKRLVEVQGGRIWVQRRPGVGSEFGFSLPLAAHEGT